MGELHLGVKGVRSLNIHGRLSVTAVDRDWFEAHRADTALMMRPPKEVVSDRAEGDNVTCTAGLTAIAASLVWAGLQDQAANLGITTATYLTPLYGAIGTGNGTVAASDTALFSEYARQTVGAGASTPATPSLNAQTTWLFYFPSPTSSLTITEAGLFANATSTLGAGSMLDHWEFSPAVTFPNTDTLILQASFAIAGS
jgi:hypothetical protein